MRSITTLTLVVVWGLVTFCSKQNKPVSKLNAGAALKPQTKDSVAPDTANQEGQQPSIGKAPLTISTSQSSSLWTEEDVDDDGMVEASDFLYDAQKGVVYTYREDDFACSTGGTAVGGILQAFYADGNKAGQPVRSGWSAMDLDETQCGAKHAGIYGCRFDADGNPTTCGVATINKETGDIDVAVAK
jgi:hypothetical protein